MNRNVLITGVSGAGKSTLEGIFREKGYRAVDIDRGFAEWRYVDSGSALGRHPEDAEELSLVYWALKSEELESFVEASKDSTLVFGSTNDLYKYVGFFDKTILLEYPNREAVIDRLLSRSNGGYGKTQHERDSVLSYMEDYQDTMKALGAKVIDCTIPLDEIVAVIEAEVQDD